MSDFDSVSCAYCLSPLPRNSAPRCVDCQAPHHADCWNENGGCAVLGCTAAPLPEAVPTNQVSAHQTAYPAAGHPSFPPGPGYAPVFPQNSVPSVPPPTVTPPPFPPPRSAPSSAPATPPVAPVSSTHTEPLPATPLRPAEGTSDLGASATPAPDPSTRRTAVGDDTPSIPGWSDPTALSAVPMGATGWYDTPAGPRFGVPWLVVLPAPPESPEPSPGTQR